MNADFEMLVAAEALDAAMVQTAEGEVLYWSPGADADLGYARAEALGRSIEELTVAGQPPRGGTPLDPRDAASRTRARRSIASATRRSR